MTDKYNKYYIVILFILIFLIILENKSLALDDLRGCCSGYGGVLYKGIDPMCRNNRVVCKNGQLSPNCICEKSNDTSILFNNSDSIIFPERTFNKWFTSPFTSKDSDICMITTPSLYNAFQYCFSKKNRKNTDGYLSIKNTIYPYITIHMSTNTYLSNNHSLSYSIDNGKYLPCEIINIDNYGEYASIDFKVDNISKFTDECQKGSNITFCITNINSNICRKFSLSGFTNSYSYISNILGNY